MAVVLSDLRQHLEGQLAAKKTALVETEENLRSGFSLDISLSKRLNTEIQFQSAAALFMST